jgi:hypothetical protein
MDRDTSSTRSPFPSDEPVRSSTRESLKQVAKRLQLALKDSDVAVSYEVVRMARDWEDYRDEAGGLEIGAWLVKEVSVGRSFGWYRKRVDAADWIGKGIAEKLDGGALVWLWGQHPDDADVPRIRKLLSAQSISNRGAAVCLSQVRRLCADYVAKQPEGRRGRALHEARTLVGELRARCARLETQVRELGGEPVE